MEISERKIIWDDMVKISVTEPLPPTFEEIKKFKAEAIKELANLKNFDDSKIFYDDESPKLTDEELKKMERIYLNKTNGKLA